jgi:hypothetical protein
VLSGRYFGCPELEGKEAYLDVRDLTVFEPEVAEFL